MSGISIYKKIKTAFLKYDLKLIDQSLISCNVMLCYNSNSKDLSNEEPRPSEDCQSPKKISKIIIFQCFIVITLTKQPLLVFWVVFPYHLKANNNNLSNFLGQLNFGGLRKCNSSFLNIYMYIKISKET